MAQVMFAASLAEDTLQLDGIKKASAHLVRLYRMTFLKRKRVKRIVKARNGKVCHRGFEYRYSLSSQGRKYLKYKANPPPMTERILQLYVDLRFKQAVEKELDDELKPFAYEISKVLFPKMAWRPVDERFPPQPSSLLLTKLLNMIHTKNKQLAQMDILREEVDALKKQMQAGKDNPAK